MKSSVGTVSEGLGVLLLAGACFLYFMGMNMSFTGTYGFSSSRRLSAMFSNIASIFSMTCAFAG